MDRRPFTQSLFDLFFRDPKSIGIISLAILAFISLWQPLGVIAGFAFLLVLLLVCVRRGSFAEIGLRRPESWAKTLLLGLAIGIGAQLLFAILIDPLLGRLTGSPLDLSSLEGMRGNLVNFIIMLAIGWVVGGFLEEMLFRGYLLKRIEVSLGGGALAAGVGIVLTAAAFGVAHGYQSAAGVWSTGLFGVLVGFLFVWSGGNLWLPILVHGVSNTVGIALIYLSLDKVLGSLVFA